MNDNGPALGLYVLGAIGIVAIADTRFAPVAVAFLAAAVIYNFNYLRNPPQFAGTPLVNIANPNDRNFGTPFTAPIGIPQQ